MALVTRGAWYTSLGPHLPIAQVLLRTRDRCQKTWLYTCGVMDIVSGRTHTHTLFPTGILPLPPVGLSVGDLGSYSIVPALFATIQIPRPIHHLRAHICTEVSGCPPAPTHPPTHTHILQHHAPPHSGPVNVPSQSERPIRRCAFRNELPPCNDIETVWEIERLSGLFSSCILVDSLASCRSLSLPTGMPFTCVPRESREFQ
ncbi:hypothetical protein LZ31DRAFT_167887 [Colletotrichum somersetense]|nr:hypothetical protein LZ31DRAFT_167887 [Colletotrichum somersetense]